MKKIIRAFTDLRFAVVLYALLALAASIQSYTLPSKSFYEGGPKVTHYNNYTIFVQSYHHLAGHQDLYVLYPGEHADLYKYTPTFSVFFGLFAPLPAWLGLVLWNLLNALALYVAVRYLPVEDPRKKGLILLLVAVELMTSLQNQQSNGLLAGLLVLSFGLLERKQLVVAALCVVLSAYIKLFGILGGLLFLLYPERWRLILYGAAWSLILFLPPLLFITPGEYLVLLKSYSHMLSHDHAISTGYSVMGWLQSWFSLEPGKNLVVAAGLLLLALPLVRTGQYGSPAFRIRMLCSLLIWLVIFNHKAESPTYIIAMAGAAIWFVLAEKTPLRMILFISALVLTSLSPTDLFPRAVREHFLVPYTMKAVPCILIWGTIFFELIQTCFHLHKTSS